MLNALNEPFPFDLDTDEIEAFNELARAYDNFMLLVLQKRLNVKMQIIDDEHITVEGQLMNIDEFNCWLEQKLIELGYLSTIQNNNHTA